MLFFENIVLQMYLTLTIHFTDKTYLSCFRLYFIPTKPISTQHFVS